MDSMSMIKHELLQASDVLDDFMQDPNNLQKIEAAATLLSESFKKGNKVISCGNGGSHCDAMHFAEELTGRFREDRTPMPAICISDVSHITCVGNDFGFEQVFSRYIGGVGAEGDVLMAISTSGKSMNVVNAAQEAKRKGMKVIALTGNSGGDLAELADIEIRVPYYGFADRIQEIHIKIIHVLILLIEKQS
ncbi:MAG: D-sedoheptulose 7-phosphate isomerase [Fulvivirga sp.]